MKKMTEQQTPDREMKIAEIREMLEFYADFRKWLRREEILQERLDRVAAIVDVIEQHGDLDATVLTQLRQALRWLPDN